MNMVCYEYKTYTSKAPRLKNVTHTYVLTMAHSTRLHGPDFHKLCQITETTVVQINHRGSASCRKPECTKKSNFDLVHAYQSACKHASTLGDVPVLFLEDDASIRADAQQHEFDSIDEFISTQSFDVYTFGSIGVVPPWGNTTDHYSMLVLWHTQATIWSAETRRKLIGMNVCQIPHIDAHFLSGLKRKVKFKRPLILQTFQALNQLSYQT